MHEGLNGPGDMLSFENTSKMVANKGSFKSLKRYTNDYCRFFRDVGEKEDFPIGKVRLKIKMSSGRYSLMEPSVI